MKKYNPESLRKPLKKLPSWTVRIIVVLLIIPYIVIFVAIAVWEERETFCNEMTLLLSCAFGKWEKK